MQTGELSQFVGRIKAADGFVDGARYLVDRLLDVVDASSVPGRTLRGLLHLRVQRTGYRDLVILERSESDRQSDSIQPSTTGWQHVSTHGQPVALDVVTGRFSILGDHPVHLADAGDSDATATIQSLRARGTTHILLMPLEDSLGQVRGMVSLESSCREAIGGDYPWAEVVPQLDELLIAGVPYLLSRPSSVPIEDSCAGVLPVESQWIGQHRELLNIFARQSQPILLTGATGVGKTYLAQWFHLASTRQEDRFVHVPLSQVGDDTGLAQLFGWRKGAFTGATADNPGWVAGGENGTLFFDDVDCLSLQQQEGLLRFMDSQHYRRLGEATDRQVRDTRIIVATNADLSTLIKSGDFREDLYHRINMFHLDVPALKDRLDELPGWVRRFGAEVHAESGHPGDWAVDDEAVGRLRRHNWPGNLRELNRVVQVGHAYAQAVTDTGDVVIRESQILPLLNDQPSGDEGPVDHLYTAARLILEKSLEQNSPIDELVCESKGLVYDMLWLVAYDKLGDGPGARKTTAKLLRQSRALESRNYVRVRRRAVTRLQQFITDQAATMPASVRHLLET